MASTRPVSGEPIASLWGQEVHDVAIAKKGVQVSGANWVGNGTGTIDLNAVLFGDPAMVDLAANKIIIPFAGIWRLDWEGNGSGLNTGTSGYNLILQINGTTVAGAAAPGLGGTNIKMAGSVLRKLNAADTVNINASAVGGAATGTQTLSVLKLTAVLEAYDLI